MKAADKLLIILSNSNGHLVAQQRPPGHLVTYFYVVIMVVLAIFLIRVQAYKMLFLPAGLAILFLLPTGQRSTLQIEVDQNSRTIGCSKLEGGKIASTTSVKAGDLASAEMQFNRGARRIILVFRDGHQFYPLGEAELQDEPNQYVVLNALRQVIGQTPLPLGFTASP